MLNTGDTSMLAEVLAPDWEDIPLSPGRGPGREGYRSVIAWLLNVFPDLTIAQDDIVVQGDRVAVRSSARGTQRAEILGVAPTGRQIEFETFDFHRLEKGQIAQSWHLEDLFGLLRQLGATVSS